MAPHSSPLAWRIPGMGEPGGLLSMGSHRVGHDWSGLAAAAASYLFFIIIRNSLALQESSDTGVLTINQGHSVVRFFLCEVAYLFQENLNSLRHPFIELDSLDSERQVCCSLTYGALKTVTTALVSVPVRALIPQAPFSPGRPSRATFQLFAIPLKELQT